MLIISLMKKLLPIIMLLLLGGCGPDSGLPIKRNIAAVAYFIENNDRLFVFYMVENAKNLYENPNEEDCMIAYKQYISLEIETPTPGKMEGTYTIKTFMDKDIEPGEAFIFDSCTAPRSLGPIDEGTVTITSDSITITGTTPSGRTYDVRYTGPFQKTNYITTLAM